MSDVTVEIVKEKLATVNVPDKDGDLVSLGMVSDIFISEGKVIFSITVASGDAEKFEAVRKSAEDAVSEIPGVVKSIVALTAEKLAGDSTSPPPVPPSNTNGHAPQGQAQPAAAGIPGIEAIIAVASGKGGVGKSTTAVNLALAFRQLGLKVGILDADVYGPSLPRMLGITEKPEVINNKLPPLDGYGLKVMSMGFMVEEDTPMIWRGPMVMSALTQMLREVEWGELDLLVVDMPPGTGDAQLTMAQQVPLAGAIIVSTPQDIALVDARKGLNMFRKVEVPILGIIENMSMFICPKCGEQSDIFGHGGAQAEANKLKVPFLGGIPLHMDIRKTSDAGTPVVTSDPDGPHAAIYMEIADKVLKRLEAEHGASQSAGPNIVFE